MYAAGDIIEGGIPLTPVVTKAGKYLAQRLFSQQSTPKLETQLVPSVVFSHPPMATIGMSESAAIKAHGQVNVKTYTNKFMPMFRAVAHDDITSSTVKIVCAGRDETVVGIHAVGSDVDEILQGFALAMKVGITKADLEETFTIHPTSAEEFLSFN